MEVVSLSELLEEVNSPKLLSPSKDTLVVVLQSACEKLGLRPYNPFVVGYMKQVVQPK